jgi:superfamily II DNA or RNA helicase
LIRDGYLAKVKHFAPSLRPDLSKARVRGGDFDGEDAAVAMRRAHLTGDALEHYRKHCRGGPALGYAPTISYSQELAAEFRAAGIKAAHVDADTPAVQREEAVAALATGELQVLFNVGLFTEGLDVPALAGVLLLRPTLSLGLYLQMCGRALRPSPDKEFAVILDHAGNCFVHGLCDDDQEWSLSDRKRRNAKPAEAAVKKCPECQAIVPTATPVCPHCGAVIGAQPAPPPTIEGELEVADPAEIRRRRVAAMPFYRQRQWAGADYERLRFLAEIRGYRPGWAFYEQRRAAEAQRGREMGK